MKSIIFILAILATSITYVPSMANFIEEPKLATATSKCD